jgi:hypothetical protein
MAERPVLVGLIPQAVVLDPGDQVSWISDAGNLRVEFDPNRSPFSSNIFQAPMGMRLLSGPPTIGTKAGSYKYRLWLNDQMVGRGEVIVRDKEKRDTLKRPVWMATQHGDKERKNPTLREKRSEWGTRSSDVRDSPRWPIYRPLHLGAGGSAQAF